MDGVLVDSEPVHARGWQQALSKYGLYFENDWYKQWFGVSDGQMSEVLVKDYNIPVSPKNLEDEKREITMRLMESEIKPLEGLKEQIDAFRHLKLAVATSSSKKEVSIILREINLEKIFDSIISSEDTPVKKPAPDPYLMAALALGCDPEQCVAIEDSSHGIQAAVAAGMTVLGIMNQANGTPKGVTSIFPSTVKALEWLKTQMV